MRTRCYADFDFCTTPVTGRSSLLRTLKIPSGFDQKLDVWQEAPRLFPEYEYGSSHYVTFLTLLRRSYCFCTARRRGSRGGRCPCPCPCRSRRGTACRCRSRRAPSCRRSRRSRRSPSVIDITSIAVQCQGRGKRHAGFEEGNGKRKVLGIENCMGFCTFGVKGLEGGENMFMTG